MTKFQKRLIEALKEINLSVPAREIAVNMGTDSRAVATGMRALVKNGCVSITYRKGTGYYRLLRVKPKETT